MDLRSLLSEKDLQNIDNQRCAHLGCCTCSSYDLLRYWRYAKSEHLYKLLGDKLMTSFHFKHEMSNEDVRTAWHEIVDGRKDTYLKIRNPRPISTFMLAYHNWDIRNMDNIKYQIDIADGVETKRDILRLIDPSLLFKEDGIDKAIYIKNPKTNKFVKFNTGAKAIRILGKIAEWYNLAGFEDFRLTHSQVLNEKYIEGDVVLSIHPLDYMTMSDSTSWESCMSWLNNGEFQLGTTEMLNSTTVIVAYMNFQDKTLNEAVGVDWPEKRWRQLFVVDKEYGILSVKGYPYQNSKLTKAVMDKLQELAEQNLGMRFTSCQKIDSNVLVNTKSAEVRVDVDNVHMYNDVGAARYHYFTPTVGCYDTCQHTIVLEYSGVTQCMKCGNTSHEVSFSMTDSLSCDNCNELQMCEICGEVCWESESSLLSDGIDSDMTVCDNCYNHCSTVCSCCGESFFTDNAITIKIIPNEEETPLKMITLSNFYNLTDTIDNELLYSSQSEVLCPSCISNHINDWLVPGAQIWKVKVKVGEAFLTSYDFYYVHYDDIANDEWKKKNPYEEFVKNCKSDEFKHLCDTVPTPVDFN